VSAPVGRRCSGNTQGIPGQRRGRRCVISGWQSSRKEVETVMARTRVDTWDLASSVGDDRPGRGASRALASKNSQPVIRSVAGAWSRLSASTTHRMADGEIDSDQRSVLDRERMCEQIAWRTRYFDDFPDSAAAADSAGVTSLRARIPGPNGCSGRRIRDIRDRPATGHRVQIRSSPLLGPTPRPNGDRWRSIFATTADSPCETGVGFDTADGMIAEGGDC